MDPYVAPHLQVLEELHRQIVEMVAPLDDEQVNRTVPGLANTIGIVLRHAAGSERYWVGEILGGFPAYRDRDAEFGRDRVQKAQVLADFERTAALTREVLGRLSREDLLTAVEVQRAGGTGKETKLFALLHATRHLAYHAGQIRYLTRLVGTGGS
ncbi:MAG: DinB family protein [Armatimonadota bacterium]|nr:DinB family protein [Armatimonadota bacterium]